MNVSVMSNCISGQELFGYIYAVDNGDKMVPIQRWTLYGDSYPGDSYPVLQSLVVKVFSKNFDTISVERCSSTFNFIHSMMEEKEVECDWPESLGYVGYNLILLFHHCEEERNDKTFKVWDNNPERDNLEDVALVLEHLEADLFADG